MPKRKRLAAEVPATPPPAVERRVEIYEHIEPGGMNELIEALAHIIADLCVEPAPKPTEVHHDRAR